MPGPGRPRSVITIAQPKPGRPRRKPCQWEGCKNLAKRDFRYCGWHGQKILHALRQSPAYRKDDQQPTEGGNGGSATMNLE